jgi:hypothetical protein
LDTKNVSPEMFDVPGSSVSDELASNLGNMPYMPVSVEELEAFLLEFNETSGEGLPSPEKLYEISRRAPEPVASGNDYLIVQTHELLVEHRSDKDFGIGARVKIKNVSGASISKIVIDAILYDFKGNSIEQIQREISCMENNVELTIRFKPSQPIDTEIKSYNINIASFVLAPEPVAIGNANVTITKHRMHNKLEEDLEMMGAHDSVEFVVKNVTGKVIDSAVFEITFYDSEGTILNIMYHNEKSIKPNVSRLVTVSANISNCQNPVKSYRITCVSVDLD